MPVYLDVDRRLVDTMEVDDTKHDWHPGNVAAAKLFRCVECLRDIEEHLENISTAKALDKKKRRAKLCTTALHSLAGCVRDLLNDCENNPDTSKSVPAQFAKLIPSMRSELLRNIPIGKDGLLATVRDKTAAHVDKSLGSYETSRLMKRLELHEVGLWLDVAIAILCEVLKLPVYYWTCESPIPGAIRMLMCEPFLLTLRIEENEIAELLATHAIKRSPKQDVSDLVIRVVNASRFLFRPGDPQIRAFYGAGLSDGWASSAHFLSGLDIDGKSTA